MEKFSECLRELIGKESVNSVAKKIGINQQTLSRYILGQREIGLENLCKIADYFDESLDVLTGRKKF
ncbi:MAG: helix-turn-helix domain-containing protein [Christensenellales bacterium]